MALFKKVIDFLQQDELTAFYPNCYIPLWRSILYDYACLFSFGLLSWFVRSIYDAECSDGICGRCLRNINDSRK